MYQANCKGCKDRYVIEFIFKIKKLSKIKLRSVLFILQIKARKKVAITVLLFVLMFAICFLPIHTFLLFFYFYPNARDLFNAFWHYFRILGFCLCYINSCANPVALYFVSGAFRKHFNR